MIHVIKVDISNGFLKHLQSVRLINDQILISFKQQCLIKEMLGKIEKSFFLNSELKLA